MKKKNIIDLKTDRVNINTAKRNLGKGYIAESVLEKTIKDEKKESELQELEDIIKITDNNQSIIEKKDGSLTYRKGGKVNTVSDLQKSYLMDTFMGSNSYQNGDDVLEEDTPIQFGYHDAAGNVIDQQSSGGYDPQGFYPEINYDPVNNPWHKALSERFQAPPPHLLNFDWQNALTEGGSYNDGVNDFNPNHLNILADYAYSNPNSDPKVGGLPLIRYQNQFAGTTTNIGKDGGDRRRITKRLREKYPSLSRKESKQFYDYLGSVGLGNTSITPLGGDTESSKYRNEYASNFVNATSSTNLNDFRASKTSGEESIISSQLTDDSYTPIEIDPALLNEKDLAIFNADPSTLNPDDLQRRRELHGLDENYDPSKDDKLNTTQDNIDNNVENEITTIKKEVKKNLKKTNKKDSLRTIGDKIGLASIVAGGLGQLGAAMASRHSDLTPKNVYKDITKDAESYLRGVIGEIDGLKKQAASEVSSRYSREPDTAMTYQQRRARELSRQSKVDEAVRASNLRYDGMKLGVQGELSKMIAEGNKYEAAGEAQMLAQAQANKDAFYTSLGQAAGTISAAGQKWGQDLNVARQNKEIVNALKTSGYEVKVGPDGTLGVFYNGEYKGPFNKDDGTFNNEVVNTEGGGVPDNVITTPKDRISNKSTGDNNVKITSTGKANADFIVGLDDKGDFAFEINDIVDWDMLEDGSLRLNPTGEGYYLHGQKVYGEPNYITKDQYKEITGKDYKGELTKQPKVDPYGLFDSEVVGQANIGTEIIDSYTNEWGKTVNVYSPLNVNAEGIAVFENMSEVPNDYDNSDYIVVKDDDGVYYGYIKSDDGKKWEKQIEEVDKIPVFTPIQEGSELMTGNVLGNLSWEDPYVSGDSKKKKTINESEVNKAINEVGASNKNSVKEVINENPILNSAVGGNTDAVINPIDYIVNNGLIGIREEDTEKVQFINDVFDELLPGSQTSKYPLTSGKKAWCGAFVYEVLTKTDLLNTIAEDKDKPNSSVAYDRVRALDYLDVGKEVTTPKVGDVIVVSRMIGNRRQHHVAFYAGENDNGNIIILGGNQGYKGTGGEINFKALDDKFTIHGYRRMENMTDIKQATVLSYRNKYGVIGGKKGTLT